MDQHGDGDRRCNGERWPLSWQSLPRLVVGCGGRLDEEEQISRKGPSKCAMSVQCSLQKERFWWHPCAANDNRLVPASGRIV